MSDNITVLDLILCRTNSTDFAILPIDETINLLVQHVRAAMDCAEAGETFRQSTQTINLRLPIFHIQELRFRTYWIDEWRLSVTGDRIHIELDSIHSRTHWLIDVSTTDTTERSEDMKMKGYEDERI